jgi:hypothetical protein
VGTRIKEGGFEMKKIIVGGVILISLTFIVSSINMIFEKNDYSFSLTEKVYADEEYPTLLLYWNARDGYYCDPPAYDCFEEIVHPPKK